ncbi:MAG: LPS export ABC transporter periplasmic protein LptC [Moraxellaceae bacterium]|nr:LPS export ABC transporter periplasmic protein LptC [Moraxellaceae bacterium]
MKRLYTLFPLILAALLAAATFWLEQFVSGEAQPRPSLDRHDPDAIVEGFRVQRFNLDGSPQFILTAERGLHYPDDDTADLVAPRLRFTGTDAIMDWSADAAHLSDQSRIVELTGRVVGTKHNKDGSAPQTLVTERLTVLTDDEIARTDAPLTMTQGISRVDGVGGEWDNLNGLLKLNQARATLAR